MASILGLGISLLASAAFAQQEDRPSKHSKISSITVCSPIGLGGFNASCENGNSDTKMVVLGAGSSLQTINEAGVGGASDEHSTVFPPRYLPGVRDYLFFVASGFTGINPDIGVMVLSSQGPDHHGQWTMQPAFDYGNYPDGRGTVFLAPTRQGRCPQTSGRPDLQDQTFDLGYAAAGSLFRDPTGHSDRLLMIYEGTNACVGNPGGAKLDTGAYETIGVATSIDGGRSWPRYASNANFDSIDLPLANPVLIKSDAQGPNAPFGATGASVCTGNVCPANVPDDYGRYQVLSPPVPLDQLMKSAQGLGGNIGNSEPSAFIDDVHSEQDESPFVYIVYEYVPGSVSPSRYQFSNGRNKDLMVARGRFNRNWQTLEFLKWNGHSFNEPGRGGLGAAILPDGAFTECGDPSTQTRAQGSISYVEDTRQYLLTFVCSSPGDPVANQIDPSKMGTAWFYSTTDNLSDQSKWSSPKEIAGSWAEWTEHNCAVAAWYPSFMSLFKAPGRLTTKGYVFFLWGAQGSCKSATPPKREYSTRQFTIVTERH